MSTVTDEDEDASTPVVLDEMPANFLPNLSSDRRHSKIEYRVQQRDRTPDMAVQGFDGNFHTVHAREVKTRVCTREVFNFAVSAAIVMSALLVCLILLAVRGFDAPGSEWLKTIAAFLLGVFLPNPSVKAHKKNRVSS